MPELPLVLITGAGRRLGKAIALYLGEREWDVAVHFGQSTEEAEGTVAELEAVGARAQAFAADLSNPHDVARLIPAVREAFGRPPKALVNSASIFEFDDIDSTGTLSLDKHWQINARAPILLAQAMRQAGVRDGAIVNILDQKLFNLNPDYFAYTVSKQALEGATHMLARALAPDIRVNAVAPGLTLPSGDQTPEDFALAHRQTPLGRGSSAQDIAEAVEFLLNGRAITGHILPVDGGQRLRPSERDVMFLFRQEEQK